MKQNSTFSTFRRRLAPFIRPILERFTPLTVFAVAFLKLKQKGSVERCGYTFSLPSGDFGVTFEIESTGSYEPVTTKLLESILHKDMTFVDVGAHVGLFTIPACGWVGPSGRVVAFEPHPGNYDLLRTNASVNEQHPELIHAAVSDVQGEITLHLSGFNSGDHQIYQTHRKNGIQVQCVSLDLFFAPGETVHVIKIDVQGAEAAAFAGMDRVLQDNHHIQIIWELSPAQLKAAGASAEDLLQWLTDRGFFSTIVDDVTGEITECVTEEILAKCPADSYVNILSKRNE